MTTPIQTHRRLPPIPPLQIPSGTLAFSAHDLIKMEKEISPIPGKLIKGLTKKWKTFFRLAADKNKNIREFMAPLTNLPFKNRFNVLWQPPQISVDVFEKMFRLSARPTSRQDQLCFDPIYDPGFNISITGHRLKVVLEQFFDTVNQTRWCSNCGEFSWNYAYNSELELCDHCLMEEICAFSKTDTHHCSICLENGKRMYKTRCGHHFHRKCLSKIEAVDFGPKCPLCRTYLDIHDEHLSNMAREADMEDN